MAKAFYGKAFGWSFVDYGPDYAGSGGTIVRPIYAFPGGRRFHFADPAGNELAVWSDSQPRASGR